MYRAGIKWWVVGYMLVVRISEGASISNKAIYQHISLVIVRLPKRMGNYHEKKNTPVFRLFSGGIGNFRFSPRDHRLFTADIYHYSYSGVGVRYHKTSVPQLSGFRFYAAVFGYREILK
jgi:hypothetical protein